MSTYTTQRRDIELLVLRKLICTQDRSCFREGVPPYDSEYSEIMGIGFTLDVHAGKPSYHHL